VAVVLFPLIGPIIEALFGLIILLIKELMLLFVPAQEVRIVTPRGLDSDGKGLRILLGVKDFSSKRPEQTMPPNDAASILAAAEHAPEENKNFAYRNRFVQENNLPTEVYTVSYRSWLQFEKAIKAWRAATDINLFKKQVSGVNDFSYELKAEDGKTEYAHVVYLFDDRIELPKEAEVTAANPEQNTAQAVANSDQDTAQPNS
jgi:hypothetical protein